MTGDNVEWLAGREKANGEPLCPAHARDEALCQLLREAIAAWEVGQKLIVWDGDRENQQASRLTLTRDWYDRARDAVGD